MPKLVFILSFSHHLSLFVHPGHALSILTKAKMDSKFMQQSAIKYFY